VERLRQGFLSNITNPTVLAMCLSVLSQFLRGGHATALDALLLAYTVGLLGLVWQLVVVVLVHRVRAWTQRRRVRRSLDAVTGTVLVGFGIALAADTGLISRPVTRSSTPVTRRRVSDVECHRCAALDRPADGALPGDGIAHRGLEPGAQRFVEPRQVEVEADVQRLVLVRSRLPIVTDSHDESGVLAGTPCHQVLDGERAAASRGELQQLTGRERTLRTGPPKA
jgi:hypothetical protein